MLISARATATALLTAIMNPTRSGFGRRRPLQVVPAGKAAAMNNIGFTLDPSDKHVLNACRQSKHKPAHSLHSATGAVLDNCKKETTHE